MHLSCYLYESVGGQFLVQPVECQFTGDDAGLRSDLPGTAGGGCRAPLGIETLLLDDRDLHAGTYTTDA